MGRKKKKTIYLTSTYVDMMLAGLSMLPIKVAGIESLEDLTEKQKVKLATYASDTFMTILEGFGDDIDWRLADIGEDNDEPVDPKKLS